MVEYPVKSREIGPTGCRRPKGRRAPAHSYSKSLTPLEGVVLEQMVRCGKPNCRCACGGPLHGPYHYRFWRDERDGRLRKSYVRKADVETTRARCEQSRRNLAAIQAIRREVERDDPVLREANRWMRQFEHILRLAAQVGLADSERQTLLDEPNDLTE